jgi:hypothetical protein
MHPLEYTERLEVLITPAQPVLYARNVDMLTFLQKKSKLKYKRCVQHESKLKGTFVLEYVVIICIQPLLKI